MERLSERERELVALGAALGSNCVPCMAYHVGQAQKVGLADEEIAEAVELADTIRKIPAAQALRTAHAHLGQAPGASPARPASGKTDCGC